MKRFFFPLVFLTLLFLSGTSFKRSEVKNNHIFSSIEKWSFQESLHYSGFTKSLTGIEYHGGERLKNSHVLVYTKNGKGYVHDNIASAVTSIRE